jgi:rhodanese-related sulfurtransferase
VYCAGGVRSLLAADSLKKMGYSNVVSLAGGIRGWKEAGNPVNVNTNSYSPLEKDY